MAEKDKPKNSKHIKCDIRFDNNAAGIFQPGDAISGIIELTLEKNKKFRGICLRINGFAATYWNSKVLNEATKKKRKANFKGREDYFSTINYFVGSDVGNPLEVVAGTYQYPFSCTIPENAPASMEGKYGHIRYLVKISLERPWKHDIVYQVPIIVKGNYDLNTQLETLSRPAKAEAKTSFYFGLTEPLIVTATTPRSGYAPGQVIELVVHVNNQSSVDVRTIVIKLQRVDTFLSQVPRVEQHIERTILEERKTGKMFKRQDARFEENILVGGGIPSDESRCRIIQTKYEIEIIVYPIRSRKRLVMHIPIVFGTTGITDGNTHVERILNKQREAMQGYLPAGPSAPQLEGAFAALSLAETADPPSYSDLQAMLASTSRAYSISSNGTFEEPMEHESEKGSNPYTPRDF